MENLQIGDLVMCREKIYPDMDKSVHNMKLVIGWITAKDLNGYFIHWSDKDCAGFVNCESAYLTRNLFLEKRKEMGI